ncbi:hypothetical protein [Methylorubrum zatmanii]
MSVQITIHGGDAHEALHELRWLSAGLLGTTSLTPPAPAALTPTETSDTSDTSDTSQDEAPKQTAPKGRGGRPKKEAAQPAEVPADDKAQDTADEQAETKAAAPPEPEVTKDDLRKLLGQYGTTYGMDAAMTDCPQIMGFPNVSAVPDTQEAIREAMAKVAGAIEANPHGRTKA